MLQALKLDAQSPAPPRNREAEPQTGMEAGFAAFLAQAAWLPPAPPTAAPPAPSQAKTTDSPSREVRPSRDRSEARPEASEPRKATVDEAPAARTDQAEGSAAAKGSQPAGTEEPRTPASAEAPTPQGPDSRKAASAAPPATPLPGESLEVAPTATAPNQAPVPSASSGGPRAVSAASPGRLEAALGKPPASTATARPVEALELRLQVEPEAARTWSATGTVLRPLQEFLAQPRPPLETPVPIREASPPPPPAAEQAPTSGSGSAPSTPQPESPLPAAAALLNATAAVKTTLAPRDASLRTAPVASPVGAAGAVQAATTLEAPQPLSQSRTAPPVLQVEGSIRWMIQNRHRGAELHLQPESLGRITIRITVEGTEVHARVWASEATTLPLLQEHRTHLEQALREQGLNLGSFDLNQGGRGDASQEPHRSQANRPVSPLEGAEAPQQDLPTADARIPGGARLLEVFA